MAIEKEIRTLIEKLNEASDSYYNTGITIMSDKEYDNLFDKLSVLEQEYGIIYPDSPTQKVGAKVAESKRPTAVHEFPAKSLGKTQDKEELKKWLGNKEGVLSWKLDGQTVVLTYQDGKLISAITRGNGEIGTVVTDVAKYMDIPTEIPRKGKIVLRGESVMSYKEFNRINDLIGDEGAKYKNPRNLAVGTLNTLGEQIHAERKIHFIAFQLVYSETEIPELFSERLALLSSWGFDTVEHVVVNSNNLEQVISVYEERIENYEYPSDGLVLAYEDAVYGENLGDTGHHPKHSIAFKWADECEETKLIDVEWSASKTGLLNPVAIFEPVEIEGTTVQRASVHNVSIFKKLALGKGDRLMVYKANMIIPQIDQNLDKSATLSVPDKCPVCGGLTEIMQNRAGEEIIETLYCTNPECPSKTLGKLVHFASRNAMNIEGISEKTIELLYSQGYLRAFTDFYYLKNYAEEIVKLDGMGITAVDNMISSIEKSKKVELKNFLNALSIPMVGKDTAKLIADNAKTVEKLFNYLANPSSLISISGIGEGVINSIENWSENHLEAVKIYLLPHLDIQEMKETGEKLKGMTFVITGSLVRFPNRDALVALIEENGGKVSGSVSKNTTYLINNDVTSTSGKNKKAKELNIPIISEERFMYLLV